MAKNDEKSAPEDKTAQEGAAKVADEQAKAADEGLVKMAKDGETLFVHPSTVAAHKAAGWHLA